MENPRVHLLGQIICKIIAYIENFSNRNNMLLNDTSYIFDFEMCISDKAQFSFSNRIDCKYDMENKPNWRNF